MTCDVCGSELVLIDDGREDGLGMGLYFCRECDRRQDDGDDEEDDE